MNPWGSLTRPNKMCPFFLSFLSELFQSVKTSVIPLNNELSNNEPLLHPLNLALTCCTSWGDICLCVALCHGNKKSSNIVSQTPNQSVLLWVGKRALAIQCSTTVLCLSLSPTGSSLQDTQAGCKSHKKSHYCLSQDPKEEEEEGSRYERDLVWGSRGTGFKGWCWHLQTVDIKYCLSLFNYFNVTCPGSWRKLCLAFLLL